MKLPENVQLIIDRLNLYGYRADVVGGPVRDFLLGKTPDDYDITTDALPEKIKEIFSDFKTVDTGIKHGTVSLILGGVQYEITTYRIDGEYKDARRPESVSFTASLEEDLCRRDFTVNAMCYNPRDGITDLHGGREDLQRGIIRAVGDPYLRFSEDALRILRALRFASVLGFELEEKTALAAIEKRELLALVSRERIYTEWKKLLSGKCAYRIIKKYFEIISVFLPEIPALRLPSEQRFLSADYLCRMLSLFALGAPDSPAESFNSMARNLRLDRQTQKTGATVLSALGRYSYRTKEELSFLLMSIGEESARVLVRLEVLLGYSDTALAKRLDEHITSGATYRLCDLTVNGSDLFGLGLVGEDIGRVLNELLRCVVLSKVENERGALLALAQTLK